jgi:trigger factor
MAGKEVRFDVTLVDIKEKVLPEVNDDFAKDLGQGIESLDDLKARIREEMTEAEKRRAKASCVRI